MQNGRGRGGGRAGGDGEGIPGHPGLGFVSVQFPGAVQSPVTGCGKTTDTSSLTVQRPAV